MPFRVERSSADVRDGFYRAVRLILFESGSEPVDADVAVHVKRACASATASQSGETRTGGVVSSAKISRTNFSIADVKANLTPFRRSALIGRSLLDKSGKTCGNS